MRALLLRLCALWCAFLLPLSWGGSLLLNPYRFAGASGGAHLVNQNFEGAGYDNGETWTPFGTPDPDYEGTVLKGSQSYRATGSNYSQISFAGQTTVYVHCRVRFAASSNITNTTIQLTNEAETVLVGLHVNQSNAEIKLNANGGLSPASASLVFHNQTYLLWFTFISGGTCELAMNRAGTTKPTEDGGGFGNVFLTRTGAADTATKLILYAGSSANDMIVDNVIVSTSPIGDNPNP